MSLNETEIIYKLAKELHEFNRVLVEGNPEKLIQPLIKGGFKGWEELTDVQREGKILVAKEFLKKYMPVPIDVWQTHLQMVESFRGKRDNIKSEFSNVRRSFNSLERQLNNLEL